MRYLVLLVIFKVCESISAEPGHGSNSLAELDTWPCRNVAKPASIANDFNDTGGSNRSSIISTNHLNWTAGKPERVARFDFSMANWHAPFIITNCDPAVMVVRLQTFGLIAISIMEIEAGSPSGNRLLVLCVISNWNIMFLIKRN